jgi:hypothetical protein
MDSNEFNIKFHARQAFAIFKYKNLKAKLVNCNANIYFNRTYICQSNSLSSFCCDLMMAVYMPKQLLS